MKKVATFMGKPAPPRVKRPILTPPKRTAPHERKFMNVHQTTLRLEASVWWRFMAACYAQNRFPQEVLRQAVEDYIVSFPVPEAPG